MCHFVKILLYPVVRFSFALVTRVVAMLETLLLMSQSWKMSVTEPFKNLPGNHRMSRWSLFNFLGVLCSLSCPKRYEELPNQVEVSSFPAHNEVVPAARWREREREAQLPQSTGAECFGDVSAKPGWFMLLLHVFLHKQSVPNPGRREQHWKRQSRGGV